MNTDTKAQGTPPLSALLASSCLGLLVGSVLYGTLLMMSSVVAGVDQFLRSYLAGFMALLAFAVLVFLPTTRMLRKLELSFAMSMLVLLSVSLIATVLVAVVIGGISGAFANVFVTIGTAASFLAVAAILFSAYFARKRSLSYVVTGAATLLAIVATIYVYSS